MGILSSFGKNKVENNVVEIYDVVEQEKPKKRAARVSKKDLLASNIKETNWPSDIAALAEVCESHRVGKKNVCFNVVRVKENEFGEKVHQNVHLAFAFYTDEVGGLSVNAVKAAEKAGDESKGELVQQMNDGAIKIMATGPMLDDNMVVIMPEEATIAALNEFRFMRSAKLVAFFIADASEPGAGGIIVCDSECYFDDEDATAEFTIEDIMRVFNGVADGFDVNALLATRGVSNVEGVSTFRQQYAGEPAEGANNERTCQQPPASSVSMTDSSAMKTASADKVPAIEAMDFSAQETKEAEQDVPVVGEEYVRSIKEVSIEPKEEPVATQELSATVPVETPTISEAVETPSVVHVAEVPQVLDDGANVSQTALEVVPSANVMVQYRDVTSTEVEGALNGIVYNGRQYIIDSGSFDRRFGREDMIGLHSEDRDPNIWLNNFLNEFSRGFNDELVNLRDKNMIELRTHYDKCIAYAVQTLENKFRLDSTDNLYGEALQRIEARFREKKEAIESGSNDRINALKREYTEKRDALINLEMANRRAEYDARHKMELDNSIRAAKSDEWAMLQSEYESECTRLAQMRSEMIAQTLKKYDNNLLDSLQERREEMRKEEQKLFEAQKTDIRRYTNKHRQDELDYANAVRSQQASDEQIHNMQVSHREELERLKRDSQLSIERLQDENKNMLSRHQSEIESMKLAREQADQNNAQTVDSLNRRIDELLEQMGDMDANKAREYESRLEMMRQQKVASDDRANAILDESKRRFVMYLALAVVIAIAAGCVGLVFGLNQAYDMTSAIDAVIAGSAAAGAQAHVLPFVG